MKKITFIFSLVFISTMTFGQTVNDYITKGTALHDQQNYKAAIENYEKALALDAKSDLANYELAYTYFAMGNYDQSVQYAGKAIKLNGDNIIPSYILMGSALDIQGNTDESIKLLKKAIKKTDGHYLLNYNLALNYYKVGEFDNCENSISDAIDLKPNHGSSHLLLGLLHDELGHKVQAVLALNYFLLIDPIDKRSEIAYEALMKNMGSNVEKDPNKPNTINISLSGDMDSEFMAAELMLSLMQAKSMSDEDEGEEEKTEEEIFIENTTSFFKMMGELKKENSKGIWWDFYTETFSQLAESEHIGLYCQYITQSANPDFKNWMEANFDAITAMKTWLNTL